MASMIQGKQQRLIKLGLKVDRATAVLPATTNQNLFAVAGGRVIVTGLVGEVTVAASATATNVKFRSAPTVGTAVDISANALITSAVIGSLVTVTGLFSDVTIVSGGAGQILDSVGIVVPTGNIQITTDATNTGSLRYSVLYIPLDDGATVTAV